MSDLSKVICCTPIGGTWSVSYHLAAWLAEQRVKGLRWLTEISNSVAYGRNVLVDRVLKNHPDAPHIFFCDADVAPLRPDAPVIEGLLAMDKDVAAPIVPQYSVLDAIPLLNSVVLPADADPVHGLAVFNELPREPFECRLIAGGAFLVRTEVFRSIPWPWFRWVFARDHILFSEDFYFARAARNHGWELWCEPRIVLEHVRTCPLGLAYDGALNAASIPAAEQHELYIDTDAPESDYANEIEALIEGVGGA